MQKSDDALAAEVAALRHAVIAIMAGIRKSIGDRELDSALFFARKSLETAAGDDDTKLATLRAFEALTDRFAVHD